MKNTPTISRPQLVPNISQAPPQLAVRAEQLEYSDRNNQFSDRNNPGCCAARESPNFSHVLLLRITGGLCMLFGIIEVGLGASLYTFFSNFRAGAWWSVILVVWSGG